MTQWGLDTLFNPAKRHMDDEKRRLQATREEAGDSSGGKRIDLASGKVVIRRDGADEADRAEDADAADSGDRGTSAGNGTEMATKPADTRRSPAKREPSAAAVRAAKRRGRTI